MIKASLVPSVCSWDGGGRLAFSSKENIPEQVFGTKIYCLGFTHGSCCSYLLPKQRNSFCSIGNTTNSVYGGESSSGFSFVLCPLPCNRAKLRNGSVLAIWIPGTCERIQRSPFSPHFHHIAFKGPAHYSSFRTRPFVTCEFPPLSYQGTDDGTGIKMSLPCHGSSAVPQCISSQELEAVFSKAIKKCGSASKQRGYRLVAKATNKKPQLVIPDAVRVEPGKYSYDVENALNQLSALAPRASIARCMDSYRNKLSMKDFSLIFREFGQRGDWERALRLFKYMQRQQWCKPHEHIYTILIGILGREGLLDRCSEIFEEMPSQNVEWNAYSFTALINAYGRNGQYEASLHLLARMKREKVTPNLITYNTVINACAKGGMDWEGLLGLFAQMRHEGIQPDIITYNTLLGACSIRALDEEAKMVFRTMNEAGVVPDQATYSLLVETFGNMQRLDAVSELLREMEVSGNVPDTVAYNVLLEAFAKGGDVAKAAGVFKQMLQAACSPNVHTYSTLLECYGVHGRFDEVRELFTEMKASGTAPDIVTYNTLIQTFGKGGYFKEVVSLFDAMLDGTVDPNIETYTGLLHACGMAGLHHEAGRVYKHMSSRGMKPDSYIFNGLILAYGNAALYQEADVIFRSRTELGCQISESTFNTLIAVYAKGGLCKDVLATIEIMKEAGFSLTVDTFKSCIEAFGKAGYISAAKGALLDLQAAGHVVNLEVHETLLNVYCTAGLFDEAKAQFLEIKELCSVPQVTSYILMLSISARRSRWDDAHRLLDEMQGNGMPYLHVLVAGLINGNFDEASNWSGIVQPAFDSIKVNGIEDNTMFFNSLLDALWWAGQRSRATRVLVEGRRRGVFPESLSKSSTLWSLDVHRMSVGAALTSVLSWLQELQAVAKKPEDVPKLFSITTRRTGESQEAEAAVSKLVFTTLEGISVPFKFAPWNQGRIISFKQLLIPWLHKCQSCLECVLTVLLWGIDLQRHSLIGKLPFHHSWSKGQEKVNSSKQGEGSH
ncbi:hypothetical protein GOP47_0014719 [Adiantum capillus-veneris]|uniref:Pentatricopeptide repeat-containing protein n=1 Tax=Adiantum capillus-veneris TaxID=13818 RepID=A0A9D4ZF32_ADICA|nr:hypothetical protein GOP47_0014719 [Adiantum capillus-veneris]